MNGLSSTSLCFDGVHVSFPLRYTALSVVPAALGKKVRDVAAKVDISTVGAVCPVVEGKADRLVVFAAFRLMPKESRETSQEICSRVEACSLWPKVRSVYTRGSIVTRYKRIKWGFIIFIM